MPNAVSVATAKLIRVIATGLGMNIKPADAVKGCRLPTLPRSAKTTTHPSRPRGQGSGFPAVSARKPASAQR